MKFSFCLSDNDQLTLGNLKDDLLQSGIRNPVNLRFYHNQGAGKSPDAV